MKKFLFIGALVLLLGAFVVGCAKSDEQAVEDTITDMFAAYNAEDYDKCLTYVQGVTDGTRDMIKTQLNVAHGLTGDINIDKIENVTVNDSSATAKVTFKVQDQTQSVNMTLAKVDGKWKLGMQDIFPED